MCIRNILFWCFLLCLLCAHFNIKAQKNIINLQDDSIDSLAYFEAKDSLYNYIRFIQKKNGSFSKIDSLTKKEKHKIKLDYFEDHQVFREPRNKKEYDLTRWYYANKYYQHRNYYGDFEKSIPIGLKASEYAYDSLLLDRRAFYVEFELANNYSRLDDHSRALYYMKKCVPGALKRKDYRLLSLCYLEIGDICLRTKNYTEAKTYYQKAIHVPFEKSGVSNQIAITSRFRKLSFETKDGKFLDWVEKESTLHKKNKYGNKNHERKNNLTESLGDYYKENSNWNKALSQYQKSVLYYKEFSSSLIRRELAKVYVKIAECYIGIENYKMVRQSIISSLGCLLPNEVGSILPSDAVLYAENTFGSVFDIGFEYYNKKYDLSSDAKFLDTAYQLIKLGIVTNDLINKKIFYSQGKLMSTDLTRSRTNNAIDALWRMKRDLSQVVFKEEFRYLLDKSKDQILLDQIELRNKLSRLDSHQREKADHLMDQIVKAINNGEAQQAIVEHQTVLDNLLLIDAAKDAGSYEILDYFEYVITENDVYLNTNLATINNYYRLGSKQKLKLLIDDFLEGLKKQEEGSKLSLKSSTLSQFLIPERIALPFEFTIVPDGIISLVPFDVLTYGNSYLIEKHLINIITSSKSHPVQSRREISNVLCINPEYDIGRNQPSDMVDRAGFYFLPFAQDEVDELESIFMDKIEVQNSLERLEVLEKLKQSNIFHFTGHAKATDSTSYLVLKARDSLIYWDSNQIYHANLDLELVTLSACETGLGKIVNGDGVNSIARSFLSAGAKSVIYSLWTVNDKSTSEIMGLVYENLAKGQKKHAAIRNAKLSFYKQANPQLKHPYYWGGFTVTGDVNQLLINQETSKLPILLFLGVISLIVFIVIKTKYL